MSKNNEMGILKRSKEPLAIPLRNCDVGTAKAQSRRFEKYCDNFGRYFDGSPKCYDCPLLKRVVKVGGKCEFMWAQMSYIRS